MNDICINCGKEHKSKLWGAICDCGKHKTVHQMKCNGCDNIIGYLIEDDFVGPSLVYCHECLKKAKTKKEDTVTISAWLDERISFIQSILEMNKEITNKNSKQVTDCVNALNQYQYAKKLLSEILSKQSDNSDRDISYTRHLVKFQTVATELIFAELNTLEQQQGSPLPLPGSYEGSSTKQIEGIPQESAERIRQRAGVLTNLYFQVGQL